MIVHNVEVLHLVNQDYQIISILSKAHLSMISTVNNLPFTIKVLQSNECFKTKMSLDVNISEPEEFKSVELHDCIKEVAKNKGIEEFDYHVEFVSGKGEHYIANIFRVVIKDTVNKNDISVIVKTLVNTTRQEMFYELHKREVIVYKEVIPLFEKVQENVENKVVLPKCLYANNEKEKEIIILEDLLAKGFAMDEKILTHKKLDYLQVRLIFVELAKFHALSVVCEKNEPESFDKLKPQFDDLIFKESFLNKSQLKNYFPESYHMSLKVITDLEAKKKLEQVESKLMHILRNYTKSRKFNVLCHGDCWINNVLFKHEVMNFSQVCFVDFQAMHYASPVLDLIYFLYLCTDSDFRSEHWDALNYVYYETFKSFLSQYNIDIKEMYPKEDFEDDIKTYQPFGLLVALTELRIVTTNANEDTKFKSDDVDSTDETIPEVKPPSLFELRVNDVVEESVDNGVLDRLLSETDLIES